MTEQRHPERRSIVAPFIWTVVFFVGFAVAAVATIVGGWSDNSSPVPERLLQHAGALLLALVLLFGFLKCRLVWTTRRERNELLDAGIYSKSDRRRSDEYLARVIDAATQIDFDLGSLRAFIESVSSPARVRTTLTERVHVFHDHAKIEAAADYDFTTIPDGPAYVAFARFTRGQLAGDVQVRDRNGTSLRVLSRFETSVLVWAAVASLIHQGFDGLSAARAVQHRRKSRFWQRCSERGHGPTASELSALRAELQFYYAAPAVLPAGQNEIDFDTVLTDQVYEGVDPSVLSSLKAIRENLISSYVLVAAVPQESRDGSHVTITHSSTTDTPSEFSADDSRSGWKRFTGSVRSMLLVARPEFEYKTGEARRCVDYYLSITAPPGAVTGKRKFMDEDRPIVKAHDARGFVTGFHVRTPRPRLSRTLHLHTRDFGKSEYEDPRLAVEYYEDLPGSVSRAAIAAWALAWVIWFTGIGLALTGPTDRAGEPALPAAGPGLDTIALVLTLQGALITWIFADIVRHPLGLSLKSRLSMILTAVLSAVAGILFVLQYTAKVGRHPIKGDWSLLYVDDTAWAVLLTVAILSATYITLTLLVRQWWERHARKASSVGEDSDRAADEDSSEPQALAGSPQ